MRLRLLAIVLLGCCLIALVACSTASKKYGTLAGTPGMLEPAATVKFSDVPVPSGFKVLAQESYSFESAGLRVGVLRYQGKATPEQVINFYKEQMPMYNWNLLNVVEYGERLMNFDRDSETCIIGILAKGRSVTITVSLGPKSQVSKKAAKPVK